MLSFVSLLACLLVVGGITGLSLYPPNNRHLVEVYRKDGTHDGGFISGCYKLRNPNFAYIRSLTSQCYLYKDHNCGTPPGRIDQFSAVYNPYGQVPNYEPMVLKSAWTVMPYSQIGTYNSVQCGLNAPRNSYPEPNGSYNYDISHPKSSVSVQWGPQYNYGAAAVQAPSDEPINSEAPSDEPINSEEAKNFEGKFF